MLGIAARVDVHERVRIHVGRGAEGWHRRIEPHAVAAIVRENQVVEVTDRRLLDPRAVGSLVVDDEITKVDSRLAANGDSCAGVRTGAVEREVPQ